MRVKSGMTMNGQNIEVELDENDIELPPGAGLQDRWRALTQAADLLVIEYAVRRSLLSKEFGDQRVREILQGQ